MRRTWTAAVLLATACAAGEPHEVFAELDTTEITIPVALHTAPPPSASFKVENIGASTVYVMAAGDLATGVGKDLLAVDLDAYTPVSPGQRIPVKVTLDPRTWLWDDGEYEVQFKLDIRYFFSGQDADKPEPVSSSALPEVVAKVESLKVKFSIDCDLDNDGVEAAECGGDDCDDFEVGVRPGVDETCDAVDEDCDGAIDDFAVDAKTWFFDADGDGYGDIDTEMAACSRPALRWIERGGDCDETSVNVNPAAIENCSNGIDDDCNGKKDARDPFCQL